MARKVDIQYIRYYTDGSAARQLQPEIERPRTPARKPRAARKAQKKAVIYVDPLAIVGTAVAVVLLVMMVVGVFQLQTAAQQAREMEQYLSQLQEQNAALNDTYHSGYDLAEIEKQALALGLVPMDQVQQIPIQVELPVAETVEEPSWWENVCAFFTGLFA